MSPKINHLLIAVIFVALSATVARGQIWLVEFRGTVSRTLIHPDDVDLIDIQIGDPVSGIIGWPWPDHSVYSPDNNLPRSFCCEKGVLWVVLQGESMAYGPA